MFSDACLIYVCGVEYHDGWRPTIFIFDANGPEPMPNPFHLIRCLTCGRQVGHNAGHIPARGACDEKMIFDLIDTKLHD